MLCGTTEVAMAKNDREAKRERRNWKVHVAACQVCKKFQINFDLDKPTKPECSVGLVIFLKLWKR